MATGRVNDLRAFMEFTETKLFNVAGLEVTLYEGLAYWKIEYQPEQEREATLQAIREGLEDMRSGRTHDARELLGELRQKYTLRSR